MPVIQINQFGGMSPIIDKRKLQNGGATVADFTRLDGGDLRPFNAPLPTAPDPSQPGVTTIEGTLGISKIFSFVSLDGTTKRWLAWQNQPASIGRIDVARSPIPNDSFQRLYQTTGNGTNITVPPYPPYVFSNPVLSDTIIFTSPPGRTLGIPAPPNKPIITPINDTTSTSKNPSAITQSAPASVSFLTKHPFKQGDQVMVQIPSAVPNTGMSELSGKEFVVDIPDGDTLGLTINLRDSNTTNYSAYASNPAASIGLVFTDSDYETRSYVWTIVSDWGEEGPPSPPSDISNVLLIAGVGSATVGLNWNRPTGMNGINRARLYRTESGTNGAQFYFVEEFTVTGGSNGSAATIKDSLGNTVLKDTVPAISLGEELPSATWTAPPVGMFGLTSMPNGFFLGYLGNTVYASEAYEPHAWPNAYTKTCDFNIVGGASYGTSAVIATTGQPYLVTGADPASLTLQKLNLDAPCISAGGIISVGTGIAYPTYEGLAVVSDSAQSIVTQNIMSKAQWLAYWDNSINAEFHENTYFAFSQNGAKPSFALRFNNSNGSMQLFTLNGMLASAAAIDSVDDSLYAVTSPAGVFDTLSKWDAGAPQAYNWVSKVFTMPHPVNMGCAQVLASSYPLSITISASTDGTSNPDTMSTVGVFTVSDSRPFRLPSGFLAREWQVQLSGTTAVQEVFLATSMSELRQV